MLPGHQLKSSDTGAKEPQLMRKRWDVGHRGLMAVCWFCSVYGSKAAGNVFIQQV